MFHFNHKIFYLKGLKVFFKRIRETFDNFLSGPNMSYFGWLTLFVLWYYVDRVFSFPVNDIPMESNTMSHSAITLEAVYKTTATFLDRMQLVNDTEQSPELKVKNYFGTGTKKIL